MPGLILPDFFVGVGLMSDLVCYIPSYNDSHWVKESLASTPDWDVVISDNASDEPHRSALGELAGPRVRIVRHEASLGRVGNWRACVEHFLSSGADWMKFLMAGDLHKPDASAIFCRAIQRHPTVRHIVPQIENVWPHGRSRWKPTYQEVVLSPLKAMEGIVIGGNLFHGLSAPLVHIDALQDGFTFGEDTLNFCADMMFSMTIAMRMPTLFITDVTAEFITARRKSMQRGFRTLEHFLEEGLLRLRAADAVEKLAGDRARRNQLLRGIVSGLHEGLGQSLEQLAGDVLFPFETIAVDTPTPAAGQASRDKRG
jgi:glycosyltransferase involved in cell wall biosynthesis